MYCLYASLKPPKISEYKLTLFLKPVKITITNHPSPPKSISNHIYPIIIAIDEGVCMKILLINTNPVVSRLVSLCTEKDESIVLEEIDLVSKANGTAYDLAFVDDVSCSDVVTAFLSWVAHVGKVVYFSGRDSGEEIGEEFDTVLKKPFLPSHIQEIIDQTEVLETVPETNEEDVSEERPPIEESPTVEAQEESTIFPLASENESVYEDEEEERADKASETKVLDTKEIAQIKALLEEDEEEEEIPPVDPSDEEAYEARKVEVITQKLKEEGLEIVPEEEILAPLDKEKKPKQKKHAKMKKKSKEDIYTFEEALLAAVENMKPKKIKKLLKGAEVTIKIRFKDDK